MKRKRHPATENGYRLFFVLAILFALVTAYFHPIAALIELLSALVLFLIIRRVLLTRDKEIRSYMAHRDSGLTAVTRGSTMDAPLPLAIFDPDTDELFWTNEQFLELTGSPEHLYDTTLSQVLPEFQYRWILEGHTQSPEPVEVWGEQYLVFGNLLSAGHGSHSLAMTYWVKISHYAQVEAQFKESRPAAAVLRIDNYEDLMRGTEESERAVLLGELNKRISHWADPTQGILCRYDREHYLLIFEAGNLPELQRNRFNILESVHQVRNRGEVTATLSLGVSYGAENLRELFQWAVVAMEMALSRGGDQAVLKNGESYQFIGGKQKESDRRTKVKSRVVANALTELLANTSQVMVMGHSYPDLDVSGGTAGIAAIARSRKIPVYILREEGHNPAWEMTEKLLQLSEYASVFLSREAALEQLDDQTLVIVVDTNRPEQVQYPALLEKAKRVVVIDHHRRAATYIDTPILSFEDPYASSVSELVAELCQYILEPGQLLRQEAEALLSGIMLDTKSFTLRTGSRTFEASAYLRRAGADTAEVRKLFQSDFGMAVSRFGIVQGATLYRGEIGIAISETPVDRITGAKAADEMLNITGIGASFVVFPLEENQVMISARSIGNINVQMIVERLGGGGNAAAAGTKLQGLSPQEAGHRLRAAIDAYFDEK